MNIDTKSYKVVISGEEYRLVSDEGEKHVLQAASLVNELIETLARGNEKRDKRKILVLTALQLASKYVQAMSQLESLKQQENKLIAAIDQRLAS